MLDQKNDQLKRKEQHILDLRNKMMQQAELDATQINKLREQVSITGTSTLNKMHDIVARNQGDGSGNPGRAQTSHSSKAERMANEHLKSKLDDKDHEIKRLERQNKGGNVDAEATRKQKEELRD